MSQTQVSIPNPNAQPYCVEDDEIDLGEVFRKLANGKWFILGSVLLTILAVFAIGILWMVKNPPSTEYSNVIRLTFPTADKGQYPSGQRFSRNDIVASAVIGKVYKQNKLDEMGITQENFAGAITATPYAVNADFIHAKYKKLLENKKLTQTEIAELEKKYAAELEAARSRFAKINYTSLARLGLSEEQIQKILTDIPKTWSDIAIKDLGVLNIKALSVDFFNPKFIEIYEYIQSIQYLKDAIGTLKSSLTMLQKDEIGGYIQDPKTNMTASDILNQLQTLESFSINPMMLLIANSGAAKKLDDALTYTQNKILYLQDKLKELEEKSKNLDKAIEIYQKEVGAESNYATGTAGKTPKTTNLGGSGTILQLGSDFIGTIANLISQQNNAEYIQGLITKQLDLRSKIAEIKTNIIQLERAKKKFMEVKKGTPDQLEKATKIAQKVQKRINFSVSEFESLLGVYKRIRETRNERAINNNGALYEQVSDQLLVTSDLPARFKKLALIGIGLGVVMLFIAIMIVLVRSRNNTPPRPETTS